MVEVRAVTDAELAAVPDELAEAVARQLAFGVVYSDGHVEFRDDWNARHSYESLWRLKFNEARLAVAVVEAEHARVRAGVEAWVKDIAYTPDDFVLAGNLAGGDDPADPVRELLDLVHPAWRSVFDDTPEEGR